MNKNGTDNISTLSQKVLLGLQIAISKLVKEKAAMNDTLVISVNGEIKHVPAKDLLPLIEKDQI
jgi:hypothetical protein